MLGKIFLVVLFVFVFPFSVSAGEFPAFMKDIKTQEDFDRLNDDQKAQVFSTMSKADTSTRGIVVAEVNLSGASILSVESGNIRIGVDIANQGKLTQPDIIYGAEIRKGDTLVDSFAVPDLLVLLPGASVRKEFDYPMPMALSGNFDITVVAKTTGGLLLGMSSIRGGIALPGLMESVSILPESCKTSGGKKWLSTQLDIAPGEAASISCDVENRTKVALSVSPFVETREFSFFGQEVSSSRENPISSTLIPAGQKKSVEFPLSNQERPGVYFAKLSLSFLGNADYASSSAFGSYRVQGGSGAIMNVLVGGDSPLQVNVFPSFSTDKESGMSVSVGMVDQLGNRCTEVSKKVFPSDLTISFEMTGTGECKSSSLVVNLLGSDGRILDSRAVPIAVAKSREFAGSEKSFSMEMVIIGLVVLLFILMIGLIVWGVQRNHRQSILKSVIILLSVISFSSFGIDKASALTWSEYFPAPTLLLGGIAPPMTVFATVNLDAGTYAPNQPINVSGLCSTSTGYPCNPLSLWDASHSVYGSFGSTPAPSTPGLYSMNAIALVTDILDNSARSISFSVAPLIPPPAPTLSFSANPSTITAGNSSQLSWSSLNTTNCSASGGWGGGQPTSGLNWVFPASTTTYNLTCSGPGGSISRSVTVTVNLPPPPPPDYRLCPISTAVGVGGTTQVQALYKANGTIDCGTPSGEIPVTGSVNWSSSNSGIATVDNGASKGQVSGISAGNASISASSYLGLTAAPITITVTCAPAWNCDTYAGRQANTCPDETWTVVDSCGGTRSCSGTRSCDFNWKEVQQQ